MNRLQQSIEFLQRHHHRIIGITPGDDGVIGIIRHTIQHGTQIVAGIGKGDSIHPYSLNVFDIETQGYPAM